MYDYMHVCMHTYHTQIDWISGFYKNIQSLQIIKVYVSKSFYIDSCKC